VPRRMPGRLPGVQASHLRVCAKGTRPCRWLLPGRLDVCRCGGVLSGLGGWLLLDFLLQFAVEIGE